VIDPSEGASATYAVAAGQETSFSVSVSGPFAAATVDNEVTATATLASKYSLSNVVSTAPASARCSVAGQAKVVKTFRGGAVTQAQGSGFTFQLRQNASATSEGNTLETQEAYAGHATFTFATNLDPSQHYQLCEVVLPGWNTTLGGGTLFVPNSIIPPTLPNPNVNNMTVCVDFTPQAGGTTTFTVDNSPPPGGRALTIGFWKNWASCAKSSGSQKPVLDQTLAGAGSTGIVISAQSGSFPAFNAIRYLVLLGSTATPKVAPDCSKAVNLLNKSTVTAGKKMASDPAFNLAAQLLGAELNFVAGAGKTPAAVNAVNQAVVLLGKYQFDGNGYQGKISAADAATMNSLAQTLDNYNNDL